MAPTSLRRSRRLSTRAEGAGGKRAGALQAIEENTVVALAGASQLYGDPVKKQKNRGIIKAILHDKQPERPASKPITTKKRQREEGTAALVVDEDRRRRKMLEMLNDLELQGEKGSMLDENGGKQKN